MQWLPSDHNKLHLQIQARPHTWALNMYAILSNIGLIMMHGLNEGHITTYTDFVFQQGKFQTYIAIKS